MAIDASLLDERQVFLRDYQCALSLSKGVITALSGPSAYLPINTGLGIFTTSCLDLDRIEYLIKTAPKVLCSTWAEQTLYTLLSAPWGVSFFPSDFSVGTDLGIQNVAVKHYVSLVRGYAYTEGIPAVRQNLREVRKGTRLTANV